MQCTMAIGQKVIALAMRAFHWVLGLAFSVFWIMLTFVAILDPTALAFSERVAFFIVMLEAAGLAQFSDLGP
jgi:hypothetical protein